MMITYHHPPPCPPPRPRPPPYLSPQPPRGLRSTESHILQLFRWCPGMEWNAQLVIPSETRCRAQRALDVIVSKQKHFSQQLQKSQFPVKTSPCQAKFEWMAWKCSRKSMQSKINPEQNWLRKEIFWGIFVLCSSSFCKSWCWIDNDPAIASIMTWVWYLAADCVAANWYFAKNPALIEGEGISFIDCRKGE